MSRRIMDMKAEQMLAAFMDTYFYPQICSRDNGWKSERVTDIDIQLTGCDVILRKGTTKIIIDEKAQLYYINKHLPTFAFELLSVTRNGIDRTGWLLDESLVTDCYLLMWPSASTNKVSALTVSAFTEIEAIVVYKNKLLDYLAKNGFTKDALLSAAQDIREQRAIGKITSDKPGIYYHASDPNQYSERPINLVIGRMHLDKLATAVYRITPTSFEKIA